MMLKRLILSALALAPAVVSAQTVNTGQGRLDMSGTAPSACVISAPSSVTGANATFQLTGPQAAQIDITELVDQNTAQPRAATISLALPVICNGAHSLVVTTANGGLVRIGGNLGNANVNGGFREILPYQLSADWAGHSTSGDSHSRTPVNIAVGDGAAGQLSLTIAIPPGGAPLVAGTYADSLVIQLQVAS
jgi:hypothetical protein